MDSFTADLKLLFVLLFISVFIAIIDTFKILEFPKRELSLICVPIEIGIYDTGVKAENQFLFIWNARKAGQENRALRLQLAQLSSDKARLEQQLAETQAQIAQNKVLSLNSFQTIVARPIGEGRYLILNKGSEDGVAVGDTVVYLNNYIGQVKSVSPRTSSIQLLADPDSTLAVYSQSERGKAKGILQGQFSSVIIMGKILHQEPISVGDLVYSEGIENNLPKGLVMGTVSKVNDNPNEVFKTAEVKPNFEVSDLEIVYIIKSL